jgi:hypothetical protein
MVHMRHDAAMANLDGRRFGDGLAGGFLFRLGRPRTEMAGVGVGLPLEQYDE